MRAIPREQIVADDANNIRSTLGNLDELVGYIQIARYIEPLVVLQLDEGPHTDNTRYQLRAGFRRFAASGIALERARADGYQDTAYLELLPCTVYLPSQREAAELATFLENEGRRPVNFVDRAQYFSDLRHRFCWTTHEIADRSGLKEPTVRFYLRCVKHLHEEVMAELRRGHKISQELLMAWCKIPHEKQLEELDAWRLQRSGQRKQGNAAARHRRRPSKPRRPTRAAMDQAIGQAKAANREDLAEWLEWATGIRARPPSLN